MRASRRNRSRTSARWRERARQHLDRHEPVELNFAREVDDAHAAAAELALERVLAGYRFLEANEFVVAHISLRPTRSLVPKFRWRAS